eukprot:TRINITY_DN27838_c0_g1_i1.p1 TRINITY_DN27838_c0_g1~~TRINITY_DN27838_c0_g1_i1.p1  ORF type:complete len:299 (-),score=105.05 TRINITY_DN27838_c0_g1_i1:106-1002(-)
MGPPPPPPPAKGKPPTPSGAPPLPIEAPQALPAGVHAPEAVVTDNGSNAELQEGGRPNKDAAAGAEAQKAEQVLEALSRGPLPESDCLQALEALELATMRSGNMQAKLLAGSGAKSLLETMTAQLANADVQVASLKTVQHLAASPEGADAMASLDACGTCVAAMKAHNEQALLQQVACHALEILAFASDSAKEKAVASSAVEAILQVLRYHKKHVKVQQAALAALQALVCGSPGTQKRMADAGGIPAAVTTLVEHKKNQSVQYWGRLLLVALCAGNKELRLETVRKLHWQGMEIDLEP